MPRGGLILVCALWCGAASFSFGSLTARSQQLPGTAPIAWPEEDLSKRLMEGAHQFVHRRIDDAEVKRAARWQRDFSSLDAYVASIKTQRERFRTIIGAVDTRPRPSLERYGVDDQLALVAETPKYRVWQVRWPVVEGVWGCGLLAEPTTPPVGHVIFVPAANESPEQCFAFGHPADDPVPPQSPPSYAIARRLAEHGLLVVVPVTVTRDTLVSEDEQIRRTEQTYREWIYRQAYHMGRHVIGYEVQTVSAAIDWIESKHGPDVRVGVCGHADGGLTALYAAAVDTRIDAALVSNYFDRRQQVWREPIDRNVWSLLRDFGDAEIASLILPRGLVIETRQNPPTGATPEPVDNPDPPGKGALPMPALSSVQAEFQRIPIEGPLPRPQLVAGDAGPFSDEALTKFVAHLGVRELTPLIPRFPLDRRLNFDPAARHRRYVQELEGHVQRLVQRADKVRDAAFLLHVMPELAADKWSTLREHPTHDPAKFIEGSKAFRQKFHDEAMGRFDVPLLPSNARSRVVAETKLWTAYDIVLDVYPEFFAWGVLVLPKDLQPGERRPVVVCQHGRNGVPLDLVNRNTTAYGNAAAVLAEKGFITFAPHNLYRGEDRYRWLCRKANNVGGTLFSFIIASHDQITRWLAEQPFVDPERIAFYGLSYGGETAVRVPPVLERYCLSICSGDFNQWTRKVASTDEPFSFMRSIEWEMPYWNLGQTFDYAEMSYLMLPRPFMAERGHHDRVGRDAWVAHEYAKVRWLYAQFGLADRTTIEFFQGGHSMNLRGSVEFLQKHLQWPKR